MAADLRAARAEAAAGKLVSFRPVKPSLKLAVTSPYLALYKVSSGDAAADRPPPPEIAYEETPCRRPCSDWRSLSYLRWLRR